VSLHTHHVYGCDRGGGARACEPFLLNDLHLSTVVMALGGARGGRCVGRVLPPTVLPSMRSSRRSWEPCEVKWAPSPRNARRRRSRHRSCGRSCRPYARRPPMPKRACGQAVHGRVLAGLKLSAAGDKMAAHWCRGCWQIHFFLGKGAWDAALGRESWELPGNFQPARYTILRRVAVFGLTGSDSVINRSTLTGHWRTGQTFDHRLQQANRLLEMVAQPEATSSQQAEASSASASARTQPPPPSPLPTAASSTAPPPLPK
jgi:hypothetical protein